MNNKWIEFVNKFDTLSLSERTKAISEIKKEYEDKYTENNSLEFKNAAILFNTLKLLADKYAMMCFTHQYFVDDRLVKFEGEE